MNKIACALILCCACVVSPAAQKKMKPWTDWSVKDAQKILDDSPWGQTQIETDVQEMFFTTGPTARRQTQGATNQAVPLNLRIRFLSAKPIRQAIMRVVESQQKTPNPQLSQGLRDFVERKFDQHIVVAVDYDSSDQRFSGPVMQLFNSANLGVLKNTTYLEIKGGKRLFLQDYKPPINDGLGAKFIFPRTVDGEPFVTLESGEVRFYSEFSNGLKLNMRFKLADMLYDGQLEY